MAKYLSIHEAATMMVLLMQKESISVEEAANVLVRAGDLPPFCATPKPVTNPISVDKTLESISAEIRAAFDNIGYDKLRDMAAAGGESVMTEAEGNELRKGKSRSSALSNLTKSKGK